jgi:hypothetical protein
VLQPDCAYEPAAPLHVPHAVADHAKVHPVRSEQVCDVAGFAAVQRASATTVPSERWQVAVRVCEPFPQLDEQALQFVVTHE